MGDNGMDHRGRKEGSNALKSVGRRVQRERDSPRAEENFVDGERRGRLLKNASLFFVGGGK